MMHCHATNKLFCTILLRDASLYFTCLLLFLQCGGSVDAGGLVLTFPFVVSNPASKQHIAHLSFQTPLPRYINRPGLTS